MNALELPDSQLFEMQKNVEGRIRILQHSKDRERNKVAMSELNRQLDCIRKEIKRREFEAKRAKYNVDVRPAA